MNAIVRQALFQSPDPVAAIIRKYATPTLYLGDPNPLLYPSAGLAPSYLESTGLTPSSASAQTLGLVLERSQGAAIGAEKVVNGGFDTDASWTKGTGWTISGGVASNNAPGSSSNLEQNIGMELGRTYRVTLTVSNLSAGVLSVFAGQTDSAFTISADGTYVVYKQPSGAASFPILYLQANSTFVGSVDNVSVVEIAGNHLRQTTAADEPSLILADNLWRYRGDGVSDNFLSTLNPATSMTMMVACEFNAASDNVLGANGSGTNYCNLGINASGFPAFDIGAPVSLAGSASIIDAPGIIVGRANGTTASLWWKPSNGALSKIDEEPQNGGPTTSIPLRLGCRNNNGTAANFLDGDIYRALAIQSALQDAEIAAIARQWSRELGWQT